MSSATKYTDNQRDAIAAAVLDNGLTARAAVEAAQRGELRVEPFTIPESTARAIAEKARDELPTVAGRVDAAALEILRECEREIGRLKKVDKLTTTDMRRMTATTRTLREVLALRSASASPTAPGNENPGPSFAARVASQSTEDSPPELNGNAHEG